MSNHSGHNGQGHGQVPPDDLLVQELSQYAQERLPMKERLVRLQEKFGYHIKLAKLKGLNAKFEIPSSTRMKSPALATTVGAEKIADDTNLGNVSSKEIFSQATLAAAEERGRMVSALRYQAYPPGTENRDAVPTARGVNHEHYVDGHERLTSTALDMGPVGFGIYAIREKCSGLVMHVAVAPDVHKSTTIGHIYCDMVSLNGFIGRQLTAIHDNDTEEMYAVQAALRRTFSAELDETEWPPFAVIKSSHSISIRNLWPQWLKSGGHNCQSVMLQGKTNGLFDPLEELDVNLFQWLWPQVVQRELDHFKQYWNCHRVRKQKKKEMPSGTSPLDVYSVPESYGYEDIRVPVDVDVVEHLRGQITESRDEAFRFVPDQFEAAAEEVYVVLGRPQLDLGSGWRVFAQMQAKLRSREEYRS